ncbi:MAG: N-6 DNA methylase [Candidatus Dormibacteraeota bacterium]|nr:N-6 DNA methylase [Candidatus Dormibacteraeota bacterium]
MVTWGGKRHSWAEHISGRGFSDEEKLVQPFVFPAFAHQLLGYEPNADLAPEDTAPGIKPDFTPADAVTHPFVFETKGTSEGTALIGHDAQITRYLTDGHPRIRQVVLTNLVGARIFTLDPHGKLTERYRVNLQALLSGPEDVMARTVDAKALARLIQEFKRRRLTRTEKLQQVRDSPEWNTLSETTSSDWLTLRLDRVVRVLSADVEAQVRSGALSDPLTTSASERETLTGELRLMAGRLGVESADAITLDAVLSAPDQSDLGTARRQYCSHVAYYAATRLMLVRAWEDLGLIEPMLHDGGFDRQMERFLGVVTDVIDFAFRKARHRYRSLFDQQNGYTWYVPSDDAYADAIYELANTYFGKIQSDVLGQVYEQSLERIDRRLLGQYYTPRDIIALIWDLIGVPDLAEAAEREGRQLRVLDVATGSGGFLVEAARRLRVRYLETHARGASVTAQDWMTQVAEGLNGIEIQRFASYLAELNLLVQLGQSMSGDSALRIPPLGIITADTLSMHEPVTLIESESDVLLPNDLLIDSEDRRKRAVRIKGAGATGFLMDVACGNPPYIGEKLAAPLLARTRARYPYWDEFVGPHMDYLYWFLVLGVSKLRERGRFGFITTEYWLRAAGAKPLRAYLASRATVERIILFRDFRLFPHAPGQHSMIIIGRRDAAPDWVLDGPISSHHKPKVSIVSTSPVLAVERKAVLAAISRGATTSAVRSFTSSVSPNALKGQSWDPVLLTRREQDMRTALRSGPQIAVVVSKGVETTVNTLTVQTERLLSSDALAAARRDGRNPGIQLLTAKEVASLGALSSDERAAIRRVVNTRDVFPYAAVVPDDSPSVIYLPKPEDVPAGLSDEQIITGTPFPDGMPLLEERLAPFRALLEFKTRDRGERRPWWSLHRARADVIGDASPDDQGWGKYCLTSRWGGGSRLVVGLPPANTSPASGLHVVRAAVASVPAPYLTAIYNSTVFQGIAESLPPGQLRQHDLVTLGMPDLGQAVPALVASGLQLASLVQRLVRAHGPRWPELLDRLRADVSLRSVPDQVWNPEVGSPYHWGQLSKLDWVDEIEKHRAGSTRLGDVIVGQDLMGLVVVVTASGSSSPAATVHLSQHEGRLADALARRLRGVVAASGCVRDLDSVHLPAKPSSVVTLFESQRTELTNLIDEYRRHRELIDSAVEDALSATVHHKGASPPARES